MRRSVPAAVLLALCAVAVPGYSQTALPWASGTYVYDGAGNIKSIGADQYRYDAFGRLLSGTAGPGRSQSITYDPFGNIETMTTDGVLLTFGAHPGTNQLTLPGYNVTAGYDPAGRVTSGGGSSFAYDGADMVTTTTVDGVTKVHLYTASDERIASLTVSGSVVPRSEWTLRDASGKVLRRLEKNGAEWSWKKDYIYRGAQLLAAEVDTSARTLHFHTDHLGTPRLITGNGGAKVALHTYFPFGEEAASPAVLNTETKLKFTGHERDAPSLDYMHARYYRPNWGRFLSVDPTWASADIGKPQTWNRYSYALNNPVNMTDPDGKCSVCIVTPMLNASADEAHPETKELRIDILKATAFVLLTIATGGEILDSNSANQGEVTRYMGPGEAEYARRTGSIPNTNAQGVERPTHVTTDKPVNSPTTAQKKYELPVQPTHRATVPANTVPGGLQPTPDGRPMTSGGGSQSAATRPIPVKPSQIKPLKESAWTKVLKWLF